jgi:hypothetical protein
VSILGFWAFGTGVGDNVLLAFKEGPHHWVVTLATMLVVVHVAAAFQVSGLLLVLLLVTKELEHALTRL